MSQVRCERAGGMSWKLAGRSVQPSKTTGYPEDAQLRRAATTVAVQESESEDGRTSLGSLLLAASGGRVCIGAKSRRW